MGNCKLKAYFFSSWLVLPDTTDMNVDNYICCRIQKKMRAMEMLLTHLRSPRLAVGSSLMMMTMNSYCHVSRFIAAESFIGVNSTVYLLTDTACVKRC